MPNFAQVTLIGHIGRDPEIRTVGDMQVASFSLATSRKRREQEITTWWNCAVWGKRADVIRQYVSKGDAIQVVGEPLMRKYTDKDGYEAQSLDVTVSDFTLLGGRRDGSQGSHSAPVGGESRRRPADAHAASQAIQAPSGVQDFDGDIPF